MMIKSWLIRIVSESKKYIALQVAANWVGLLANIAVTISIAGLLETLALGGAAAAQIPRCVCIVAAAVAVRFLCTLFAGRMSFLASDKVKQILRERIYQKLLRLGISYNQHIGTSEAVQIAGEGVDQLEVYFGSYLPQLFYSLLAPITLFVTFLFISVKAAVILMICVPLIPAAIMGVQQIAKRLLKKYWGVYADLGGTFLENVQGLTTLKIYEADEAKHIAMNEQSERFRNITMKVLYMQLNSITVMDVIAYVGAAAGIIVSVLEYTSGRIGFAGAFTIIMLSADFFIPLRQLGSFFHVAMNGMAASDKMKALFDLPEDTDQTEELTEGGGEIRFENVHFSYDDTREILGGISFAIPKNGFVSVVGESGCGKSTIAGLVMGIYKGYTGSITIAGKEVRDLKEASIMEHMTLVNHNSYLFQGTVRENLKMGNPTATEEQMIKALKEVNLYDFLMSENGLDTMLREQGGNFSGGQRQRLALARAILHNTDIYIFDEATSNIDVESEEDIMKVIRQMAGEKTVILISHRLANVEKSDCIYVMEKGSIVEQGTQTRLLEENGLFAQLYRGQEALEAYGRSSEANENGATDKSSEADGSGAADKSSEADGSGVSDKRSEADGSGATDKSSEADGSGAVDKSSEADRTQKKGKGGEKHAGRRK